MSETSQISLFGTEGVDSLQKNGFRSTANAVAEIVDNSIQAKSENVQIILSSKNPDATIMLTDGLIVFSSFMRSKPVILGIFWSVMTKSKFIFLKRSNAWTGFSSEKT